MFLSLDNRQMLAARASFIEERLTGQVLPENIGNGASEKLVARWRELLSGKIGEDVLPARLELAGTSLEKLTPLLGDVIWNPDHELPEWVDVLAEILESRENTNLPARVIIRDDPIPFEDIWLPYIGYAYRRIMRELPQLQELFSESSVASWLRVLLKRITGCLNFAMLSAFDLKRSKNSFPPFTHPALQAKKGGREKYLNFTGEMLSGGWLEFCKNYPVAVRMAVTLVQQDIDYFVQVAGHLKKDLQEITRVFNLGKSPGKVKKLESRLSDPHYRGRTVVKFTFESGLQLIYKPRRFEIDRGWEQLLSWITSELPELDFIAPKAVENDHHVWVEFLENKSMNAPGDAAKFYRRAGAVLTLIYVLGGTDFHQENLLACGQYPVLIDLETLLRPLIRPFSYATLDDKQKKELLDLENDSVLRTCMLPMWMPISKQVSRDYGALTPDDNASYVVPDWLEINTDRMRRENVDRTTYPSPNVPHFNGELKIVTDHIPELIAGFESVYRLLMDKRELLLSGSGPLSILKKCLFRFLPRNTQVYMMMTRRLQSPRLLRDGALFSIEVEGMAQPFLHNVPEERLPRIWKIFELERESLLRYDFPVIQAKGDEISAFADNRIVLDDYFLLSGFDEVRRRVEYLNDKNLDMQLQLINASLACRYPKPETDSDETGMAMVEKCLNAPLLNNDKFVAAAEKIAAEISEKAVWRDEQPQWLTRKFDPMTHNLNIGPVDALLYEGSSGIGLFLAAYTSVTGDDSYRKLAAACFGQLEKFVESEKVEQIVQFMSVGYAGGICGAVWSSWLSGHYLQDNKLKELSRRLLGLITPEAVNNDKGLDILAGSAGGVLSFLTFHRLFGDRKYLDIAVACGEHLLKNRIIFNDRKLWNCDFADQPLTGFGHGSAGFACALLELYEATGDEKFREAAKDPLDYETENFDPKQCNWPDFRQNRDLKPGTITFMGGWCSGAPGIGLGRLMTLNIDNSEQANTDIENTVKFISGIKPLPNLSDHLCCGYTGRIDFLIEAAVKLKRPELLEEARKQLSFVVNRAKMRGRYTFNGDVSGAVFTPGLFSGVAGVGLTCLRLAYPEKIASVLTAKPA